MLKVAITGHTRGLGAALFERFSVTDMVSGLSRSNGCDIRNIPKICEVVKDADIFINNAYDRYSQVDLLYAVYDMWKDQDKKIINISSMASEGIKSYLHPYAVHKIALDAAFKQIASQNNRCKVVNIKPSWIDTPRVERYTGAKICPNDLADLIYTIAMNELYVTEVKVLPNG